MVLELPTPNGPLVFYDDVYRKITRKKSSSYCSYISIWSSCNNKSFVNICRQFDPESYTSQPFIDLMRQMKALNYNDFQEDYKKYMKRKGAEEFCYAFKYKSKNNDFCVNIIVRKDKVFSNNFRL